MKLIKVKGIVIKEISYSDNDKIITLLTDKMGTITCMAKGAKKTSSHILASSQYLVYSEFVLFKGSSFYYINSASTITTFYKLRIDFDKLNLVFLVTKSIISLTDENIETSNILKLFLNMLYLIENDVKNNIFVVNIFKIKLLNILGFSPQLNKCNNCNVNFEEDLFYDISHNIFLCIKCSKGIKSCIKVKYACYLAVKYIINSDISKVYSLCLKDEYVNNFDKLGQALIDCIIHGI